MIDNFGRNIDYLRLSITERCNLRCLYCREDNEECHIYKELSVDEIENIVKSFVDLGITKVRITGGEPLVRHDTEEIISRISKFTEIKEICLTTNGQNIANRLENLKKAGLTRINFSLDSFIDEKYSEITRGGNLQSTLEGIDKAINMGFNKIKVNVVLIKGQNDNEINDFVQFTKDKPIDLRFIEMMPIGKLGEDGDKRVLQEQILDMYPDIEKLERCNCSQPSEDYKINGFLGNIGFISPMSHKFCNKCNRVRVTADGNLKLCLGNNKEADLKPYLGDTDKLTEVIRQNILDKPEKHSFDCSYSSERVMSRIGG